MEIPILIGALVIGALLLVLGLLKVGKTKKTGSALKVFGVIGLLIAAGAYFDVLPATYNLDLQQQAAVPTPTTQQTPSGICAVEDTTVTLSSLDAYTALSTGESHRYSINGGPALTVADAGTFTASPGDRLAILYGNASAVEYFSVKEEVDIPCKGTATFSSLMYKNGTVTIEVFNEEANLITGTESETLSAGDVVTLAAKLKGTYQRGIPYGGIIVAEYNNSAYDKVEINFGGEKTSVPGFYTVSSTENTAVAYKIPPILSNQIIDGSILIDVDDTDNPAAGDGALVNVSLDLYPNDYFLNEDLGGLFDGPAIEDEDNVQTLAHKSELEIGID